MRIKKRACLVAHQIGSLDLDEGFGNRELHALVLADGVAKDLSLARIGRDLVDKPVTVPNALGRTKRTFRIKAGHYVSKKFSFFTNEVFSRDLQIVEE